MSEKTLKERREEIENDTRTITLTKKEFMMKSMDALLNDEHFKNDAMMFMFGTSIIAKLTESLFKESKEGEA